MGFVNETIADGPPTRFSQLKLSTILIVIITCFIDNWKEMSSIGIIALSHCLKGGSTTGIRRIVSPPPTLKYYGISVISPYMPSPCICRQNSRQKSSSTDAKKSGFEDLDKPIKFTTSAAAEWKAANTHGGGAENKDIPSFQPFIVVLSVSAFLLYFLVLREENDVDEEMKRPLWERVPGLERKQIEMLLEYNQEHNLPVQELKDRLEVVKKQQEQIKKNTNT